MRGLVPSLGVAGVESVDGPATTSGVGNRRAEVPPLGYLHQVERWVRLVRLLK